MDFPLSPLSLLAGFQVFGWAPLLSDSVKRGNFEKLELNLKKKKLVKDQPIFFMLNLYGCSGREELMIISARGALKS